MTRALKVLLVCSLLASVPLLAACGDDDDGGGGGDPCADAAAVETNAIADYCADKTDVCCYCNCWETSYGLYDSAAYLADQTCNCSDPPSGDTAECDGVNLDYANNCLENEAQCAEWAVQTAEGICDVTPII